MVCVKSLLLCPSIFLELRILSREVNTDPHLCTWIFARIKSGFLLSETSKCLFIRLNTWFLRVSILTVYEFINMMTIVALQYKGQYDYGQLALSENV